MSKLNLVNKIPSQYNRQAIAEILRDIETQINNLSECNLVANYNAQNAAPISGRHAAGDFVRNLSPSELGTAPDSYIVYGWICTVSGEPGTWRECRFTIGNEVVRPGVGSIVFTGAAPTVS